MRYVVLVRIAASGRLSASHVYGLMLFTQVKIGPTKGVNNLYLACWELQVEDAYGQKSEYEQRVIK